MASAGTAMAGEPWPWGTYPVPYWNTMPWYPQHWDAPSDPKVLEVALVGHEEYHVIGVFVFMWNARKAAARALLSYRRYWRSEAFDDFPYRPRGTNLHVRITSRKIDHYQAPVWESGK